MKKLIILLFLILLLLAACGNNAASPTNSPEVGTYNLSTAPLAVKANEAGGYVLYTNSTQITVEVPKGAVGSVILYDAASEAYIQSVNISDAVGNCAVFQALSAANRYRITCDGLGDAEITISDGT